MWMSAIGHRYEVNPEYIDKLEADGLSFVGRDETGNIMEILDFLVILSMGEPNFIRSSNHALVPGRPSAVFLVSSISANINNIPVLNGINFKKWKKHVMTVLGCMDLDIALRMDRPMPLSSLSTTEQKVAMEKWERSDRMSLMIMQNSIPDSISSGLTKASAKEFLKQLSDRFSASGKVETSTALSKLVTMRYNGKGNIREYIMNMSNLVTKLRELRLVLSEDILVHLVLISLPVQYNTLKISYNSQKEKWSLNDLIAHCVQEEDKINQEKTESAHLASTSGVKRLDKQKKDKGIANTITSQVKGKRNLDSRHSCFFCKRTGIVKKMCYEYAVWRAKKGLPPLLKAD